MDTPQKNAVVPLRLSREELMVTLAAVSAPPLVGMDFEPVNLTSDQEEVVSWTAQRALMARRLAAVNGEGMIELHPALIELMTPCLHAERVVMAHYWPSGSKSEPIHLFAHIQGKAVVLHTLPAWGQHEFLRLPSKTALVIAMLTQREKEVPSTNSHTLSMSAHALNEARRLAESGSSTEAASQLPRDADGAADAFATSLAANPAVTVVQIIEPNRATQELMWLRDDSHLWLLERRGDSANPTINARTMTIRGLGQHLLNAL